MADDVGRVRSLVGSTGFFNGAEVDIAADLVTERLSKGIRSGYHFILAERGSGLVGLRLLRPDRRDARLLRSVLDRGAPEEQRKGLGPQVFARAESAMRKAGAKKIYVDTSSSDRYAPTRGFYQRMGFEEDARLPDFYGPGDAKVIYVKQLEAARRTASLRTALIKVAARAVVDSGRPRGSSRPRKCQLRKANAGSSRNTSYGRAAGGAVDRPLVGERCCPAKHLGTQRAVRKSTLSADPALRKSC